MQLLKLSNLFNTIAQAHPNFNHYHFGWRSDIIQNVPNNFDANSSTGKLFPSVHFAVPEQINTSLSDAENKDVFQVTLYFDNLQDYNNNGTANTKTLVRQWSELAVIAKEYLYNVQRLLERDYSDLRMDTDSFRLMVDSEVGQDRLISVKAVFDITTFGECITTDLEPSTLPANSSSLYPAVGGYDYEDLFNLVDVPAGFDRCQVIYDSLTEDDKTCLLTLLGGGTCDWNNCTELIANLTEATKNTCILPTYDFTDADVQSNVTGQQQTDLINWLCVDACVADFKVNDLSHAEQIDYNVNDTVCIADTAYTAVELYSVSGRIKGQFEVDVAGGNYYYIVDQGNSSLLRHNASAGTEGLAFFNTTNGNGYEAVGKPYLYNNKLYIQNSLGGANGVGTYCVYDLATNITTKLFDLSTTLGYDEDNYDHARDIVEYNGKLFVTLSRGGANGVGTVICYDTNTDTVTKVADLQASANILITNTYDAKAVGYGSILNDVLRIFYRDRFLTYDLINDVVLSDIDLGFATQNTSIHCALFTSNNRLYVGAGFIGVPNGAFTFVYDIANSLSYTDTTFNTTGRFSMYENAGELFILSQTVAFAKYDITEAGATSIPVSFNLGQPSGHTIDDLIKIGDNLYFSSATGTFNGFLIQSYDLNTSTNTQIVSTLVTVGPTPDGVNLIDVNQVPIYLKMQ